MLNQVYLKGLNYQVGSFHLKCDQFFWSIETMTALMAPSGSGKSTLLRILAGLESGGKNFDWGFQGQSMAQRPIAQRHLGVVFQDYALFPHLNCRENLKFALEARAWPVGPEMIDVYIEKFELQNCANTLACHLSGGEAQRTAFARALIAQPRFLLLDEPFAALDHERRQSAREFIKSKLLEFPVPTLLVTHDPQDITFFKAQQFKIYKHPQGYHTLG